MNFSMSGSICFALRPSGNMKQSLMKREGSEKINHVLRKGQADVRELTDPRPTRALFPASTWMAKTTLSSSLEALPGLQSNSPWSQLPRSFIGLTVKGQYCTYPFVTVLLG